MHDEKKLKKKQEISLAGDIAGAQAPGVVIVPVAPQDELENQVVNIEFDDMEEVVKKVGNTWKYYDDETGAERGSFKNRKSAWDKQRSDRSRREARKQVEKQREKAGKEPKLTAEPKKEAKEIVKELFKKMLTENTLQYVFESPADQESVSWENFLARVSRETIMSDQKLKNIVVNLKNGEAKILQKAAKIVKDALNKVAGFEVKDTKVSPDPETKMMRASFKVKMKETDTALEFGIKIENGRPVVHIPDEARQYINSTGDDESKRLRSELIHVQETELNQIDDVTKATKKRDAYLLSVQNKLDRVMNQLSPVEIAMLKHLMKEKYRAVK